MYWSYEGRATTSTGMPSDTALSTPATPLSVAARLGPGLLLCAAVALAATGLQHVEERLFGGREVEGHGGWSGWLMGLRMPDRG